MNDVKRFSLIKPTLETPFHIDLEWWQYNDRNWRVYMRSLLCPEHQEAFAEMQDNQQVDWIDPETAEVKLVDGVQHALISHCARQPEFLTQQTALVEAVFRMFLANGNVPMNSIELGARLNRPAETILKTISGPRVYRGLRPQSS